MRLIIMTAGVSVGTLLVTQSPASAACSYYSYPSTFAHKQPTGTTDTKIWIALRRQTTSSSGCNFYAVVSNLQGTGRDDCKFSVYNPGTGAEREQSCPLAGQSSDTGVINVASGYTVTATLDFYYNDATDYYPTGHYVATYTAAN